MPEYYAKLLIPLFGAALLTPLVGRVSRFLRDALLFAAAAWALALVSLAGTSVAPWHFHLLGFDLVWRANPLTQLFSVLVLGLGVLTLWFAFPYMRERERANYFFFSFGMSIAASIGVLVAGDFLSLFFFWEMMTWSSFLNVIYYRYEAQAAGLKYFVMSLIGAYSMLLALVLVNATLGTLQFGHVLNSWSSLATSTQWAIWALLLVGFGVKAAMMPLHTWAPDAYEISPAPFTAFFSGALSKLGVYGLTVLLFVLAGPELWARLGSLWQHPITHYTVAWIGAITAFVATLIAVVQEDAKRLLAYSSVGQIGYILLGFGIASTLGVAGAFYQALNHAIFKGLLFLTVGAVFYRTGTHRMDELGGLIKKMPYSFVAMLLGVISLAGIPPLSGFPAKWILYEALVEKHMVGLLVVAMIASTAAFLYAYRLINTIFLGQLPERFEKVEEVPWSMRIPMFVLVLFTLWFGVYPQSALRWISSAMAVLPGVQPIQVGDTSLWSPAGTVNLMLTANTIGAVFLTVLIVLALWPRSRKVGQLDIHTSGEPVPPGVNLQYATRFYQPFERAFGPWLKASADRLYTNLAQNLENLFDLMRYVYTGDGQTYALYVILFLAGMFLFAKNLVF